MLKWMKSLLSSRDAAPKDYLIIGLGNPGSSYEKTRHNIGFRAARYFAEKHQVRLRRSGNVSAEIGHGTVEKKALGIVLPLTYMNSSGEAVKEAMEAFKVPLDHLMVIVDDVALPIGKMKLKEGGSSGGHNGLKSIEEHLTTSAFPRLRLGIGNPKSEKEKKTLADFVLSPFESEEEALLKEVFEKTAEVLDSWILEGIQKAMTKANTNHE